MDIFVHKSQQMAEKENLNLMTLDLLMQKRQTYSCLESNLIYFYRLIEKLRIWQKEDLITR